MPAIGDRPSLLRLVMVVGQSTFRGENGRRDGSLRTVTERHCHLDTPWQIPSALQLDEEGARPHVDLGQFGDDQEGLVDCRASSGVGSARNNDPGIRITAGRDVGDANVALGLVVDGQIQLVRHAGPAKNDLGMLDRDGLRVSVVLVGHHGSRQGARRSADKQRQA